MMVMGFCWPLAGMPKWGLDASLSRSGCMFQMQMRMHDPDARALPPQNLWARADLPLCTWPFVFSNGRGESRWLILSLQIIPRRRSQPKNCCPLIQPKPVNPPPPLFCRGTWQIFQFSSLWVWMALQCSFPNKKWPYSECSTDNNKQESIFFVTQNWD